MALQIEKNSRDNSLPPLVLISGWGMGNGVWEPLLANLMEHFSLYRVALAADDHPENRKSTKSIESLAEQIGRELLRELGSFHLAGWSLGGNIAAALAENYPHAVKSLMLVASNPCFIAREDWPCGMDPDIYQRFKADLATDPQRTLNRFAALQVKGDKQAQMLLQQVKEAQVETTAGLPALLTLLEEDSRHYLTAARCPVAVVLGENDALVPTSISGRLLSLKEDMTVTLYPDAGHALFLSRPEWFVSDIRELATLADKE